MYLILALLQYNLATVHDTAAYNASVRADPRQELVPITFALKDIRYATDSNLMHRPVYTVAAAFLRAPAAKALRAAESDLEKEGLGLKVFDAYRPYAVTVMFYEKYRDTNFVASPYTGSRHNRGCAVDLTLIDLKTGHELEMPTAYDAFTPRASATYTGITPTESKNRRLLQNVMLKHGFTIYPHEWWHFDYAGWKDYPVTDIPFETLLSDPRTAAAPRPAP